MIRAMTDADLARVHEINSANVPEVGEATVDHLEHLLAQAAIALVTEVDGTVVGFCLVFAAGADYDSQNYAWFMERDSSAMYLDRVAFDASMVGRGLGRAMYAEVERIIGTDHADSSGLTLEVNVDPPNERSLAFHAALGFTEVGRRSSHGIEVSMMRRDLN